MTRRSDESAGGADRGRVRWPGWLDSFLVSILAVLLLAGPAGSSAAAPTLRSFLYRGV